MKINSLEDLNSLIANQIPESKEIDYKDQLILDSTTDKIKFLQNVTSFSNAIGGNLIYGMRAEDGIPIELTGIDINNNDSLKLQLDNIIRDLTEPRINNYNFNFIPLSESKQILVIEIPKSWNSPHAVKINKGYVFHSRNSTGKAPLDIFEIRNLFLESSTQIENAKSFKIKRISDIIADQTPLILNPGLPGKLVLHIIPINAFNPSSNYDLTLIKDYSVISPLVQRAYNNTLNFEGLLLSSTYWNDDKSVGNYMQLYRNGIVEALDLFAVNYEERSPYKISLQSIENEVKEFIERVFNTYKLLGVSLPVLISISFLNVKGKEAGVDSMRYVWFRSNSLTRENYFLPEILIESTEDDWKSKLDDSFLPMWNAFGSAKRLS